jgi:formylglycine-generating enzyme required for sulfatase activity
MDAGYDPNNLYRNSDAFYFLPTLSEWHKAAYYDPLAGTYYDYPTGSDAVPDGIDSAGDTMFEAVFFEGGLNSGPNEISDVGLPSPYGTFGQGGNVMEWEETSVDLLNNSPTEGRGIRGGTWGFTHTVLLAANRNGIGPFFEGNSFGFRVGSIVPEPSALLLTGWGLLVIVMKCRVRMSKR